MFIIVLIQSGCENNAEQSNIDYAGKLNRAEFVDRQSCIECHEKKIRRMDRFSP